MKEDKIIGVTFEKDMKQNLDGKEINIKAGTIYPIQEESIENIMLYMKDGVMCRVYVVEIEDVEIVIYADEDGKGFKIVKE